MKQYSVNNNSSPTYGNYGLLAARRVERRGPAGDVSAGAAATGGGAVVGEVEETGGWTLFGAGDGL